MTAVAAKVAANWSHTPIIAPNTEAKGPNDGSAFLAITYPVAVEEMKTFGAPGANVFREDGAFRLVLSIPMGGGLNPTDTPWASRFDTLRAALRGQLFDNVTTFEASPPVVQDDSDEGEYFKLSTAVAYKFDVFG